MVIFVIKKEGVIGTPKLVERAKPLKVLMITKQYVKHACLRTIRVV